MSSQKVSAQKAPARSAATQAKQNLSLAKVLDAGVRKYGNAILTNLAIAIKVTRLYSFSHQNVTQATKELLEFLQSFIRLEGEARLSRIAEHLFINDVRIKVDFGGQQSLHYVLDLMKQRDIGEIAFTEGINEQELEMLVDLVNKHQVSPDAPWESFSKGLQKYTLPHISIAQHQERQGHTGAVSEDSRLVTIRTYFKAIGIMKEVLAAAAQERKFSLKRIKLAVHAIVDLTLNEERLLLALVNTKNHLNPVANHAVNVAVLSIATGAKLGLSKRLLGDLGLAAMLHDLGKVKLPMPLQAACLKSLSPPQLQAYRAHVSHGVHNLLTQRVVNAVIKSINVAFLHHYRFDGTGYPKLMAAKQQNLFTRIVALADYYDNATTPNRLEAKAQAPEVIMRSLMDRRGTEFDPLVVKAFINLMGLHPVGCVVRLDTGETGTVVEPSSQARFLDRPVVKLFCDAAGNPIAQTVNLLDRRSDGSFLRTIIKLYQQDEIQLDLEEYLTVI